MPSSSPSYRPLRAALLVVALASPAAREAGAQEKVYALSEVTNPPKLSSAATAARLVQESYPEALRKRGVGGMVELHFVVDAKGRVDPASVQIADATQTALGEAARKVIARFDFSPGKVHGTNVRTKVVLPIFYKP
jgi:protein TonB